jgi:hypothetical protein
MAFSTQFPVRITLSLDSYDLLIEALKGNEEDFEGRISDDAQALREKIERYGRCTTDENGDEVVRLGFYEKEGAKFIWQFIAASIMLTEYREQLQFIGADAANDSDLAETEV